MTTKDPVAKVFVMVVVVGLVISGILLLHKLTQADVNDYVSCVKAGHPIIESGSQSKCISPSQTFIKE